MAIPMPKQQDIRRLDRQGVSRSEIARRLDVDRATVAKYADMDDMTQTAHGPAPRLQDRPVRGIGRRMARSRPHAATQTTPHRQTRA